MMSPDSAIIFANRIEREKRTIDDELSSWDNIVPESASLVHYRLARSARSIGIYSLLLDRREETLTWFGKAAAYYADSIETTSSRGEVSGRETEARYCLEALELAVLAGDRRVIDRCAGLALGLGAYDPEESDDTPEYYLLASSLASFLLQDQAKALDHLNNLEATRKTEGMTSFFGGMGTALRGLMANDRETLAAGINAVLAFHNWNAKEYTQDERYFSIHATALIRLAYENHMALRPEDAGCLRKYVPWNLFTLGTPVTDNYASLEEGLMCSQKLFDDVTRHTDELKPEIAAGLLGDYARATATYLLKMGRREQATEWLEIACEHYLKQVTIYRTRSSYYSWEGDGESCTHALNAAILLNNNRLRDTCIRTSLNIQRGLAIMRARPGHLTIVADNIYLSSLASFLDGETEKAEKKLQYFPLEKLGDKADRYRGLWRCLRGLFDGNEAETGEGLGQLLAYHDRVYAGQIVTDGIICEDAAALAAIAREKGLRIHPEKLAPDLQKYIPGWLTT